MQYVCARQNGVGKNKHSLRESLFYCLVSFLFKKGTYYKLGKVSVTVTVHSSGIGPPGAVAPWANGSIIEHPITEPPLHE